MPEDRTQPEPFVQSEEIAFAANELVRCDKCARTNGPGRLRCIYCGNELEAAQSAGVISGFRKPEAWESAHNVITTAGRSNDLNIAEIAELVSLEATGAAAILDAGVSLPIARVESEKLAERLSNRLQELGLTCVVISDAGLAAEKPPVRLRSIRMSNDDICVENFNTRDITRIPASELALIIPGLIAESRLDSLEKKRRGGSVAFIDETATVADETVLDLYSRHDPAGYRIHVAGFDFSGVGEEKSFLGSENLRRLIARLREIAPDAKFVDSYASLRGSLGLVWEVESRSDPQGIRHSGFGRRGFGNVKTTSNLNQFTKFSRLQWLLI